MNKVNEINEKLITVLEEKIQLLEEQKAINEKIIKIQKEQLRIGGVGNLLKDKEAPTLKDAFIAGYKKRAEMSGLKYDDVSELNAITCFKCWKSFDL